MTKSLLKLFILSALTLSQSWARDWQRIQIPGAVCGNGFPYSIYLDKKSEDKLFVEFMAGGACWSTATCYGPRFRTWIHQLPTLSNLSLISSEDPKKSPYAQHSAIYFPYCTGDVFSGTHVADYQLGARVHHKGSTNISLALEYLDERGIVDFQKTRDLGIYGASAGAIGAFLHARKIADKTPYARKKTLLADSPGLHFGEDFWDKFPSAMRQDIQKALDDIDFTYDPSNGLVAPGVPSTCAFYHDFDIGIYQASQDLVMSHVFGEIDYDQHEELVYSDQGIYEQTRNVPNCASWVPSSKWHTYLILPNTAKHTAKNGQVEKSALDFARDIVAGKTQTNYK